MRTVTEKAWALVHKNRGVGVIHRTVGRTRKDALDRAERWSGYSQLGLKKMGYSLLRVTITYQVKEGKR